MPLPVPLSLYMCVSIDTNIYMFIRMIKCYIYKTERERELFQESLTQRIVSQFIVEL